MAAPVTAFDLDQPWGRTRAYSQLIWQDHGFLRVGYQNAHWISDELVRSNQPFPFQLAWWARRGIRTVVNCRGGGETGFHALEREACARHGLILEEFQIFSRAVPSRSQVLGARDLFERIAYPALIHCKSGSDRAGIMSVFYKHFREGQPIRQALSQLSLRYGHMRAGLTGALDYTFERYLEEAEPFGVSFLDWVTSETYDAAAIERDFRSNWWGRLLTDKILRRE
jgi:protein tyrosine/serine phosphatase